jgi:hypothetical protein
LNSEFCFDLYYIDKTLPIERLARQAFELRNALKAEARDLMKNQQTVVRLDQIEQEKSWEEMILRAY